MPKAELSRDGQTLSVHVPVAVKKRGGRKVVLVPDSTQAALGPRRHQLDTALVGALARAHRWQRMIESGQFATIGDLARAQKVNPSYLARLLRLTLLAPDIVDAILDGQPEGVTLTGLIREVPVEWTMQPR